MKKYLPFLFSLFLAGCGAASSPQTQNHSETISPMEYQECIQAAMTGNGQASAEKWDKILKDAR